MTFHPFQVEQLLSDYEQTVEYNYSESGVHPMQLQELLGDDMSVEELLATEINYPVVNGSPALRSRIAELYDGGPDEDNVLVTVGASEANFILVDTLLEPGDEMVSMRPSYLQIWGAAANRGIQVNPLELREENGWAPDLDQMRDIVTDKTKLIAVTNPNNPTGRIMSEDEMDAIVEVADKVGAWLVADEVYRGAERERNDETPSFYGRYDKVIALNGMSKAYGLPGLRTGWAVAPKEVIRDLWRRHEYVNIAGSMFGQKLTELALAPEVRPRVIARTRGLIRNGFPVLKSFLDQRPDIFSLTPPDASAMSFVKVNIDMGSEELVHRLREEKSVLLVPGAFFGRENHLRISFALDESYLSPGLSRLVDLIDEIGKQD